jgi:D-glycero-alpha-D-manno-heptose-7-phosphate kinase
MLIARAPVRISFFGGGTDLPSYFEQHGGCVLSTTIDKYVYAILNTTEYGNLQITSSDYRMFYRHPIGEPLMWDGDLSLPRAVMQHFGVEHGVSMFLASEAPPGTGLGSSSSVTVALVKALAAACGMPITKQRVAELACYIETRKLGKPIGYQDQYAAAYGGLNWISFESSGVTVQPLNLPMQTVRRLEGNLLLMFTGATHDSADILKHQRANSRTRNSAAIDAMHAAKDLAFRGRELLLRGELDRFGALLDEAWRYKRNFAPGVTTPFIDSCYATARDNGALGGKITGAGGGGFLMLYCEQDAVTRVERALQAQGLRRLGFTMEADGGRVLFNAGLQLARESTAAVDAPVLAEQAYG